ncbi:unnamed protein product [Lathyrus oleraceus]
MATGAADGFLRPIYEGSISGYDHNVERRPYHRKCGCTLHSKSRKLCAHKSPISNGKVTYPFRRSWSEGNLALSASAYSSHSPSPSTSPASLGGVKSRRSYLDLENQFDDKICGLFEIKESF